MKKLRKPTVNKSILKSNVLDVKRMNNYFLKTQNTPSLSIISKFSDLHCDLSSIRGVDKC